MNNAIDVIVVNYHCHADTLTAVGSLSPWSGGTIWVVDNSVSQAEVAALRQGLAGHPDTALIVAEANLGFGKGCNLAFAQSNAAYVLLLNPDARIQVEDVRLLATALDANPRLGAVSPLTFWDEGRRFLLPPATPMTPLTHFLGHLGSRFPDWMRRYGRWWLAHTQQLLTARRPVSVPFHAGATLMVRHSAAIKAGGLFDPAYFMFYEDSDLSLRLRQCGYRLAIVPAATAVHGYRHAPWKAPLMRESEQLYFRRRFPLYWHLTRGLSLVEKLAVPPDWLAGSANDLGVLTSAEALSKRLGNRSVGAISPCPTMVPALFRPQGRTPETLTDDDWACLSPGRYLLLAGPADDDTDSWQYFSFVRSG